MIGAFFDHERHLEIAGIVPGGHLIGAERSLYLILRVQVEPLVGVVVIGRHVARSRFDRWMLIRRRRQVNIRRRR